MKETKMKEIKNVHVLDNEYAKIKELVRQVRDRNCYGYDLQEKVFNLGRAEGQIMQGKKIAEIRPVLIYLLRAGEPLCAGINSVYHSGGVGFIAAKRDENTFEIEAPYVSIPNIDAAAVIIVDSMCATGGSILKALEILENYEMPRTLTVATAISSEYGIKKVMDGKYGNALELFTGTVSSEKVPGGIGPGLNSRGYILPENLMRDLGDDMFGMLEKKRY